MGKSNITFRVGGKTRTAEDYTRSQAIKMFCRDCMGGIPGVAREIRNCTSSMCPLFCSRPYQSTPSSAE
jgi:hypothetical protein